MKKNPNARNIHGILLLDKPCGWTSNKALQTIKRLFYAKKAGHGGSLDPLATGMLPILFGDMTKKAQTLLDADKYYEVTATLGVKTTTGDKEGEVILERPVPIFTQIELQKILETFVGNILQIPPMFSALKHKGQPLYRLARKGQTVERAPREITIFELNLIHFSDRGFSLNVHCSKGTYIRTLIEDIGEKLGCGAHVEVLRRSAISKLPKKMFSYEELLACFETKNFAGLDECLL